MREILFKAKKLDNKEWVEGYYYSYETLECFGEGNKYHYILKPGFADWSMPRPTNFYKIDPNTLCQFTGLTDKDDNKIWENDIIEMQAYPKGKHKTTVYFRKGKFAVDGTNYYFKDLTDKVKVIGNKFDNPELLEK